VSVDAVRGAFAGAGAVHSYPASPTCGNHEVAVLVWSSISRELSLRYGGVEEHTAREYRLSNNL
jgi:hypothetical protein